MNSRIAFMSYCAANQGVREVQNVVMSRYKSSAVGSLAAEVLAGKVRAAQYVTDWVPTFLVLEKSFVVGKSPESVVHISWRSNRNFELALRGKDRSQSESLKPSRRQDAKASRIESRYSHEPAVVQIDVPKILKIHTSGNALIRS